VIADEQPVARRPLWRPGSCATTRPLVRTSPRHGGSFGDAGPGRRARNTSRNRMRTFCAKSQAHVTWFLRNVDQLCPSPRVESGACTAESFVCRRGCLVLSSSHTDALSHPHRGLRPAISRMSAAGVVGESGPLGAAPPERANPADTNEECRGRMSRVASRQPARPVRRAAEVCRPSA